MRQSAGRAWDESHPSRSPLGSRRADHRRRRTAGHRIAAPKGRDTRPTSDRVRENAFNLIGPVDDADVLDLFAGSGALGLEALSRGAARCDVRRVRPRGLPHDRREPREARPARRPCSARTPSAPLAAERAHLRPRPLRPALRLRPRRRLAPHLARLLAADGLLVCETAGRDGAAGVPGPRGSEPPASTAPHGLRCSST